MLRVDAARFGIAVCFAVLSGAVAGQVGQGGQVAVPGYIADRLGALEPAEPEGYLRLGEDIAALSEDGDTRMRDIARRLFVLAFVHGDDDSDVPVRPAACYALAALEDSSDRRRWLRALAERVDTRYAAPAWRDRERGSGSIEDRVALAEAVGQVRAGRGRSAMDVMDRPEIAGLLERVAPVLDSAGGGASVRRLRTLAQRFDVPECGGRRAIPEGPPSRRNYVLCPENEGNPGPTLQREELVAYLRFEAVLLESSPDSWAVELAAGDRPPLRDPEPEELAPLYGVDPARSLWRDGRWEVAQDGGAEAGSGGG